MQMRQRDVAALDAKYTKELADAKAENDALRDDVAAGRRRLHYRASPSVSAGHHRLRRGCTQPPPTGRHSRERDYFTLRERLITCAKTTGRKLRSILMSSVDRVAHIDGQPMQLL